MPRYSYKARDVGGGIQRGAVTAATPFDARQAVRDLGLRPESVRQTRGGPDQAKGPRRKRPNAKMRRLMVEALDDLHTLLVASVPLGDALGIVRDQRSTGPVANAIRDLHESVLEGESPAAAMARADYAYDPMLVALVDSGERSGRLEEAIAEYTKIQGRWQRMRSKIAGALVYPAIVVITSLVVVGFLTGYVLPPIVDILRDTGRELPWSTRLVIGISGFVSSWWWAIAGGASLAVIGWGTHRRNPAVVRVKEQFLLRLPLVRKLVVEQQLAHTCALLHGLLCSGLTLVEALQLTEESVSSISLKDDLGAAREAIETGVAPHEAICGKFLPEVLSHVFVAANSPERVEHLLGRLADEYDRKVDGTLQKMMSLFEPIMTILLASVVGFVAFSVLLPIMEAGNVQ